MTGMQRMSLEVSCLAFLASNAMQQLKCRTQGAVTVPKEASIGDVWKFADTPHHHHQQVAEYVFINFQTGQSS
jgi:hypothetical protein